MKRRDFLKRMAGVVAGTAVAPAVIKAKGKTRPPTEKEMASGCSSSPSISSASLEPEYPHEGTLKTEVYADDELVLTYDRGLTDREANEILDKYFDVDVTFREFGWREY